jgi:hypothetical protein
MIVVSRERQHRLPAPLNDEEQRVLAALLRRLHAHVARGDEFDPQSMLVGTDPGAA